MTPEAQQIAIAEACGFTDIGTEQHPAITYCVGQLDSQRTIVPEYLYDLNACHEMEKTLTREQAVLMGDLLELRFGYRDGRAFTIFDAAHATAPQRCEAFLKAIDKWKDEA
jgi:hypothetical protein